MRLGLLLMDFFRQREGKAKYRDLSTPLRSGRDDVLLWWIERFRSGTWLVGDFAFGFVGGAVDFGAEAFEEALQERFLVDLFVLHLVR